MNTGYNGPTFVYFMQRRDDPEVFKIGVTQYPVSRQNSFFENGQKVPLERICQLLYMPLFPDGEPCTSLAEHQKEDHYGTQWRYAFYITRKKIIRMEDYFKTKFSSKCCKGKEWFRLTPKDVSDIKRHFIIRGQSDNDFFTKTELEWLSQGIH